MRRFIFSVLALLLALSTPTVAQAAPSGVSQSVKRKARRLVRKGQSALRAKQYRRALRYFQRAHGLWPRKEFLFNQSITYLLMKRKIAAATLLRRFLSASRPGTLRRLPEMFRRLMAEVCVLKVSAPQGNTTIWIDRRRVGAGSIERVVLPGRHLLQVRRAGRVVATRTVKLRRGQQELWRPVVPPPEQWREPPRRPPEREPDKPSKPSSWQRLHWIYFVVAAGLTATATGALIGTGLKTNELEKEFASQQTQSLYDRGRAYKTATNALIGVTVAAAVGAATLAIFTRWRKPERTQPARVSASVYPGGAAVTLTW